LSKNKSSKQSPLSWAFVQKYRTKNNTSQELRNFLSITKGKTHRLVRKKENEYKEILFKQTYPSPTGFAGFAGFAGLPS
jgi:arsenate reductase-like glutaredoxin family protein